MNWLYNVIDYDFLYIIHISSGILRMFVVKLPLVTLFYRTGQENAGARQ